MSEAHPVILVTGASRGLGRGIACACATAGWDVAVHYSGNRAAAEETIRQCAQAAVRAGQRFLPVQGDLAVAEQRTAIVEGTLAAFGRIDGLVNNAGIAPRVRADVTETSEASFDEVLGVNLKGPFFLTQRVTRHWLEQPGGALLPGGYKLVFVTSISAATASVNRAEYCISKAALAMVSQLFAVRLASEGVQVFEIRPGIMETDMTAGVREKYDALIAQGIVPQRRWGRPEDVGRAVRAVLEGSFNFSTGAVLYTDGGFHLDRL